MEQIKSTALLVMDMQNTIVGTLPDNAAIVSNVSKAIVAARQNGIPVIYVVVGFRKDLPEISPNNKSFAGMKERFGSVKPDDFIRIHPGVAPRNNEVTIVKRRVCAFTGSDLEVILRAKDIKHLVLTGVATSGVVLSTVREAADKDYRLTVLADARADSDEEVHRVLTTKVFPRQADVISVDKWIRIR